MTAHATTRNEQPLESRFRFPFLVDAWTTLAPLQHGIPDHTVRFEPAAIWRATRTPLGPATTRLERDGNGFRVLAWGPGREWAMEAIPRLLGAEDEPQHFRPEQTLLRDLVRRLPGLRFGRTDAAYEALVVAIVEQKVTGLEARRSYRALLRAFGEPAPGPMDLLVLPEPATLAARAYHEFHPLGLEKRRADTIRRVSAAADRLEACARLPAAVARRTFQAVAGVGPWTAAEAARVSFGDPDAVSVGDYHVPRMVCWALAGEDRGDDQRMLELLAPYVGQRARVVRLLELGGAYPPRRGPRMAPRRIRDC